MSGQMHFDRDTVDAQLTAQQVLDEYGWDVHKGFAGNVQSSRCPHKVHDNPRALVLKLESGQWRCWPCGVKGDLFSFIAAVEKLDVQRDFPAVLAKAASIAGVQGSASPLSQKERTELRAKRAVEIAGREKQRAAELAAKRERSIPIATERWHSLLTTHSLGEAYLEERGVGDARRLGLVRFDGDGNIALPLRTSDGKITNVITRRLPKNAPSKDDRFRPIKGCYAKGTYINSLADISAAPNRSVILTEGFFDSITAAVAWRSGIVIGARDADDVTMIAKHAASRVAAAKSSLILIPHADNAGASAVVDACKFANRAGLTIADGTLALVKTRHADLNDAWIAGWRPNV